MKEKQKGILKASLCTHIFTRLKQNERNKNHPGSFSWRKSTQFKRFSFIWRLCLSNYFWCSNIILKTQMVVGIVVAFNSIYFSIWNKNRQLNYGPYLKKKKGVLIHHIQGLRITPSGDGVVLDGASGKEPACQCRRRKRCGCDPWIWKIPWRKKLPPTPELLPEKIPWTEEPGRLQSIGSQWVEHDWSDLPCHQTMGWWPRAHGFHRNLVETE